MISHECEPAYEHDFVALAHCMEAAASGMLLATNSTTAPKSENSGILVAFLVG